MSYALLLLIAVASIVLLLLIIILVSQIRSNRQYAALNKPFETAKKKEKPKKSARESLLGVAPDEGSDYTASTAVVEPLETVAAPVIEVPPEPVMPEEMPSEALPPAVPEEIAVEIPEPEAEHALPEAAVEEVAEAPAAEVAFEPRPYPEFNNARAVEQLGLPQEEADMFIGELVTQIEEELPNLESAIDANDVDTVEKVSHMLKGSATSLGEGGVADVLVDFNTYCKTGQDLDIIRDHMNNLRYYFEKLKDQYAA